MNIYGNVWILISTHVYVHTIICPHKYVHVHHKVTFYQIH
jgi:hypothetical protein